MDSFEERKSDFRGFNEWQDEPLDNSKEKGKTKRAKETRNR